MSQTASLPLVDECGQIFADLRAAAGMRARKPGALGVFALVVTWLTSLVCRIDAIAARWHAGTLRPPKERPLVAAEPREKRPRPDDAPLKTKAERLPRHFAWLADLLGAPADVAAERLRAVLAHPELPTLVAVHPPAAAMLRRLCRALGVALVPVLRPQPRTPRPTPYPEPHPDPRQPPPPTPPSAAAPPPQPPPQLWSHQPTDHELPMDERIRLALIRRRNQILLYGP